jgi:uncharacterized protein YukE
MPFGLVTRTYLDQRLADLKREVERGRGDEEQIQKWIGEAFATIELEWTLWQQKLMTVVRALGKQNKKARDAAEEENGADQAPMSTGDAGSEPQLRFRSRRGF